MSDSRPGCGGEVTDRLNEFVQHSHRGSMNGMASGYGEEHEEGHEGEKGITFELPKEQPTPSSNLFFDDYMEHGNDLRYLDDHEHDQNIHQGLGEQKGSDERSNPGFSGFHEFIRSPPRDKKPNSEEEAAIPVQTKKKKKKKSSTRMKEKGKNDSNKSTDFSVGALVNEELQDGEEEADEDDDSEDTHDSDNWVIPGQPQERQQEQDQKLVDIVMQEGDAHSEPCVDALALENAAKNQAMLTESSQQMLQLGGQHASWNLGGSVESMDPAHIMVVPSHNNSADNDMHAGDLAGGLVVEIAGGGGDGSVEKGEQMQRSVSFAEANNVMQFSLEEDDGNVAAPPREHFVTPMANEKARLTRGAKALEEDEYNGDVHQQSDATLDIRTHESNRAASAAVVATGASSRQGLGMVSSAPSQGQGQGQGEGEGERRGISVLEDFEDFTLPGSLGDNERGVVLAGGNKKATGSGSEEGGAAAPPNPSPPRGPPPAGQKKVKKQVKIGGSSSSEESHRRVVAAMAELDQQQPNHLQFD